MAVCLICSGPVQSPFYIHGAFLPCKHLFHADCLREWWSRIILKTCPCCQRGVDEDWEKLRWQADAMLVRFGMKVAGGFSLSDLDRVYRWVVSEKQLNGDYDLVRALVKSSAFDVLHGLMAESAGSLVARGYFERKGDSFTYVA